MLQRLHTPAIKDPWFAKTTEKVKESNEDINMGTLTTVSLLDFDEEPEEELPGSIISRLTFKIERTPSQLLLTNDVHYVAWLTSTLLPRVRSSGEDSMVNFSDVSQTKKHIKL